MPAKTAKPARQSWHAKGLRVEEPTGPGGKDVKASGPASSGVLPTLSPGNWSEELAALPFPKTRQGPSRVLSPVVAVGSGKGGVGKTIVSSSLALALSETPLRPSVAIDVDLGGANLHTGLGIPRPCFALNRFVLDGASLQELALPSGIEGLQYVGGASDIVGTVQFSEADRSRFLAELDGFTEGTLVLDLGAGSSSFCLDLFCRADQAVLVTTPEPTAVQNAYGFLRSALYRRIRRLVENQVALREMLDDVMNHRRNDDTGSVDSLIRQVARYNRATAEEISELLGRLPVGVVVNMSSAEKASRVVERLFRVVRQYLGLRLEFLGSVAQDETVHRAVCEWRPILLHFPKAQAARELKAIAERVVSRLEKRAPSARRSPPTDS
ncbi:MAG: P-loop NTPase [Acidobacteriota bacterium]